MLSEVQAEDSRFLEELVTITHEYERGAFNHEQLLQRIETLQEQSKERLRAITTRYIQEYHSLPHTSDGKD